MSVCYIVGAGEFYGDFSPSATDLVIAADGGFDTCKRLGILPDLLIGDMDSIEGSADIEKFIFPVKKDETDTYLAYLEGIKRGYTRFEIYGGLGGRADHTLANLQLLYRIAKEGNAAALVGRDTRMLAFGDRSVTLETFAGQSLGVFALSPVCEGVTIEGAAYTLEKGTLQNDFPLGVSNTALGASVTVSVEKGEILCVLSGT